MKNIISVIVSILLCLAGSASAQEHFLEIIKAEQNQKSFARGETIPGVVVNEDKDVKVGRKLNVGDRVSVPKDVRVTFESSNRNTVETKSNAEFIVFNITNKGESYYQFFGKVRYVVIPKAVEFFNVYHSKYSVGVEGTVFVVNVDLENKEIECTVEQGTVAIKDREVNKTVNIISNLKEKQKSVKYKLGVNEPRVKSNQKGKTAVTIKYESTIDKPRVESSQKETQHTPYYDEVSAQPNHNQALTEKLIFTTADFPPYIFAENGKLTGIYVEIINEVCKRNGIEIEIRNVPWKRALKEVEEGTSHAIFAPIHTEERAKFLYYPSEPLVIEKTVALGLKESGVKASKLDDLKDKSVGIVRGYSYTPEFDKRTDIKKVECDDDKQLVKILGAKRITVAFGEEATLKYLGKQAGIQAETMFVLTEAKNFIGLSKKAMGEKGKDLADKFSKTLQDLNKEGFIEKVKSKYF